MKKYFPKKVVVKVAFLSLNLFKPLKVTTHLLFIHLHILFLWSSLDPQTQRRDIFCGLLREEVVPPLQRGLAATPRAAH